MTNTNVIKLAQPGTFTDSLTEILRNGARALLTQAVETEVADFLGRYANLKTEAGRQRVVRHGHLPEREIMTGIGPVAVRQPQIAHVFERNHLRVELTMDQFDLVVMRLVMPGIEISPTSIENRHVGRPVSRLQICDQLIAQQNLFKRHPNFAEFAIPK